MKKIKLKKVVAAGLAMTPMAAGPALADRSCFQSNGTGVWPACSPVCPAAVQASNPSACPASSTCTGSGNYCSPEMSDYLALSFVAVAGGMMLHFRRKVPALQPVTASAPKKRV